MSNRVNVNTGRKAFRGDFLLIWPEDDTRDATSNKELMVAQEESYDLQFHRCVCVQLIWKTEKSLRGQVHIQLKGQSHVHLKKIQPNHIGLSSFTMREKERIIIR